MKQSSKIRDYFKPNDSVSDFQTEDMESINEEVMVEDTMTRQKNNKKSKEKNNWPEEQRKE